MCNKFNRRVTLLPRLAKEGLVLEQSYVQPICTPTRCTFKCLKKCLRSWRSALMSGRYPIHTGRQHSVLWPEEPRGLHTSITLLPRQYPITIRWISWSMFSRLLQQQGYATHMVGKWHLGFCCQEMLPTSRLVTIPMRPISMSKQVKACPQLPRGFDTFYGYYTGSEHYFNHTRWQYHPMKFCSTWDGLLVPQA